MIGAHASTPRLNSSTRIAHSPPVRSTTSRRGVGHVLKYHQEARGSQDKTRRQPITVRDAHGCWTAAMRELLRTPCTRTSENPQNANFAFTEFSEIRQQFIANSSLMASMRMLYN